jgi:triosephosphate isomerase (TIM)
MRKLVIANWKMNLGGADAVNLFQKYGEVLKKYVGKVDIVVAPSFLHLDELRKKNDGTLILGAQNCSSQGPGPFTGEISAKSLKEMGCQYVIIGHSERRINLDETDEQISLKIEQCFGTGIVPVLCIGETREQRDKRDRILSGQLQRALGGFSGLEKQKLVIAYEPVWAIGADRVLIADELSGVGRVIKRSMSALVSEKYFEEKVSFIYGGGVKPNDAEILSGLGFLHGLLVGSASLDAKMFSEIVEPMACNF